MSSVASIFMMSMGTCTILFFVCFMRLRRTLPTTEKRTFLGIAGDSSFGVQLILSFVAGLLLVIVAGLALELIGSLVLYADNWVSPLIEETFKFAVLWLVASAKMRKDLQNVSEARQTSFAIGSGAARGMALGIGFGLGETILYALDNPELLLLRSVSAMVLHALTGAIIGRFTATIILGKTCWRCLIMILGAHYLYNFLLLQEFPFSYFVFLLLYLLSAITVRFFSFQEKV